MPGRRSGAGNNNNLGLNFFGVFLFTFTTLIPRLFLSGGFLYLAMRINPIALLIPAAAWLLVKGGVNIYNASRLNFYIVKVVPRFSGITPVLDFYLGIQNPTAGTFTVQSVAGNVYANDVMIGNLSSFTLTTVKGNSQAVLVASLRLSLFGLVQELWNKLKEGMGTLSYTLRFTGTVNVSGFPVPVVMSYKVI